MAMKFLFWQSALLRGIFWCSSRTASPSRCLVTCLLWWVTSLTWPSTLTRLGWPTHHPPHLLDHNVCFHYDRELARHAQSVRSVLQAMNDGGHLGEEILKCRLFIFFLIFVKVAPFVLIGSSLKVIWENTDYTHIGLGSGNNSSSKQYLKVRQT